MFGAPSVGGTEGRPRGKALDDELILILQPFASSILFDDFGTRFLFVLQLNSVSSTVPNV